MSRDEGEGFARLFGVWHQSQTKAAFEAKRHQGLKKLEISIIGPANQDEAVAVLREGLQKLIVPETTINKGSTEHVSIRDRVSKAELK